jgi:hypothetical protein
MLALFLQSWQLVGSPLVQVKHELWQGAQVADVALKY